MSGKIVRVKVVEALDGHLPRKGVNIKVMI